MRHYFVVLFLLASAFCVVGELALVRSLIAGRVRGVSEARASRLAEIVWIVLPAVILALVLIATWRLVASQGVAPVVTPIAS